VQQYKLVEFVVLNFQKNHFLYLFVKNVLCIIDPAPVCCNILHVLKNMGQCVTMCHLCWRHWASVL